LIIEAAWANYIKIIGTDLSKTLALRRSFNYSTTEKKASKEYRDSNRKLINCLSSAVKAIQVFSEIVGEVVSQVSHTCHL